MYDKKNQMEKWTVLKSQRKAVSHKKETLDQRREQFPFWSAVTKASGRKRCHNEKQETSDQRRVQFPFLSSITEAGKPRKAATEKIITLGQGKHCSQKG